MNIRAINLNDISILRDIHARFYAHEFSFPDFLTNFYCSFTVEDEEGIIATGGIRPLPEVVLLTNLDRSTRDRKYALAQILQASMFVCESKGHNELTAFVQDKEWQKHLTKVGFKPTRGQSLVLGW